MCSFILVKKYLSVFPMYDCCQPGQEKLYTTELWYSFGVLSLHDKRQFVVVVFQLTINRQGRFIRRGRFFLDFWSNVVPRLPIYGGRSHILGGCEISSVVWVIVEVKRNMIEKFGGIFTALHDLFTSKNTVNLRMAYPCWQFKVFLHIFL